jgi:TRAP-type C4-dicarboxylate transport system substrate-binding protein
MSSRAKPQSLFAKKAAAAVPTSAPATELGKDLSQGIVAGEEQPQPAADEQPSTAGETVR